jgi:Na+/proline symporter
MNLLVFAIFGYVALQMAVGVLVSRNIRTEADYLLAGRKLGPALATFSLFAT